jgi:hypothetical protein
MGTVANNEEKTVGYIERAGQSIRVVEESAMETAYGRRGGGLYPLVLLLVATIALLAVLLVDMALLGLVGVVSLVLLALWVGGSGR